MPVKDVAQYILDQNGPMTSMKLQKLVYYSQAWATVWDDDVLFDEQIQAWDNGPVVRELWEANKGKFKISNVDGSDSSTINAAQRETVDRVLAFYGAKNAQWLSDLTHMESPWINAFAQGQNTEITPQAMSEYYSTLAPAE
ncbi:MAG: Panacea domain-containing protein [Paracoccaceae bacterium]